MSEQRKRLNEKEIRIRRLDQGLSKNPGAEKAAVELWTDHDKAREDRKRLVDAIREAIRIGAVETPRTFELILREVDPQ